MKVQDKGHLIVLYFIISTQSTAAIKQTQNTRNKKFTKEFLAFFGFLSYKIFYLLRYL